MALPWWIQPTTAAANFARSNAPAALEKMDWLTPQSTGIKSGAAAALNLPQFTANVTPNLPEESINTIVRLGWPRLVAMDALRGAYGAAAESKPSFFNYLGGNEQMPVTEAPSELAGALKGIFAGVAPTAAKKIGFENPSIENSMLKMGEPWWSANIGGQVAAGYEYGVPDLVKAAYGIIKKPITIKNVINQYAEGSILRGEPVDLDIIANAERELTRRPWYEAEWWENALRSSKYPLPKGVGGGIPTRPAPSLYSGLPIGEGQFKFPWAPSTTERGIQAAAESAGQRFLRGASALVPAIKDTFTGEIITDPNAGIHGQILAKNPKFDELVDKPSVIRGYVNAEGKFIDRDTVAQDELMPTKQGAIDAIQLHFGAKVGLTPRVYDKYRGVVPVTSDNAEAMIVSMSKKYPVLAKAFQDNPDWANAISVIWSKKVGDAYGQFVPIGQGGVLELSKKKHMAEGGLAGEEAYDSVSHELGHRLLEKVLKPMYQSLKGKGLITSKDFQEFMHTNEFQKFTNNINRLLIGEPAVISDVEFTGDITTKDPLINVPSAIEAGIAQAKSKLQRTAKRVVKEAVSPTLKPKYQNVILDALFKREPANISERFMKWREQFGISSKGPKPSYMQYATPKFQKDAMGILQSEGEFTITDHPAIGWILRMPNGKYVTPTRSGLGHSDVFYRVVPEYKTAVDTFESGEADTILSQTYDNMTNAGWIRRNPEMGGWQVDSLNNDNVIEALESVIDEDLRENGFISMMVNDLGPEGANIVFTRPEYIKADEDVRKLVYSKLRNRRFGINKEKPKPKETQIEKPIESTPDLFEPTDANTPYDRQMEELFKNAAMLPPARMPSPPTEVPPPPEEVQPFLDLKEEDMMPREYRDIGMMQRFSNPNVYANQAGYGVEHNILAKAVDEFSIVRQRLDAERQHMEVLFKNQLPWFKKAGGTKSVEDLKKAFMFELENPEGADLSAFSPELQKVGAEIREQLDKDFWELNRARKARGEELVPYKRGYMYRLYKDEMIAQIKENNPIGPELTSGFESGINTDLGFSPGESRTEFGEKHPEAILWDPVASYFKRRELHEREMLLRPALDKVAENVKKLELIGTPYPKQIMNQMNDFIKYTVKGQPLPANEALNNSFNAIPWLNQILGPKPFTRATNALLKLQYLGTLWGNLKQYTRNPLQSINHISMYGIPNALKGLNRMLFHGARAEGSLEKQIRYPFIGLEKGPIKTVWQKIENLGFSPLQQTDMFNLIHCHETAKAWGESLEVNEGWNAKMEREAEAAGLPKDAYKWTADDTTKEADYAIQCNQFKYTVTGMPEIYRNQLGKVVGGLYSWPMNYFNTFVRELVYRAYTGRTGWQDSNGIHKPIPTAARLAALQYLLLTGAAIGLTEQVGMDYGSSVLMGAVPSGFNPITNVALGTIGLALGSYRLAQNPGDKWAKMDVAKAKYQINRGLKTLTPGFVAIRSAAKVMTGEKPWWSIGVHTKPEPPKMAFPTKQNINNQIFKGLEKPPSKRSTKWLTQ